MEIATSPSIVQLTPSSIHKATDAADVTALQQNPTNAKTPTVTRGWFWESILVALLALFFGLVTPPAINIFSEGLWSTQRYLFDDSPAALEAARSRPDPCSVENLSQFWNDEPSPGFHVVCLKRMRSSEESAYIHAITFREGVESSRKEAELPYLMDWSDLRDFLVVNLHLSSSPTRQPWAVFSGVGERLADASSKERAPGKIPVTLIQNHGLLLIYEGGQFIWPGVRIGFRRDVELYSVMPVGSPKMAKRNQTVTLETLSIVPLVFSVQGFLSLDECKHIQTKAEPNMKRSGVTLTDYDTGRPASDFRTSQTTFLAADDDILTDIDYRTASLVRVPRKHQEYTQVLRYGQGERYVSHHDYFDPAFYQNDRITLQSIDDGRRNRLVTVFWYLSDVASGGETVFPRFNRGREIDFSDCETGLKVKPEAGKVIVFYSLLPDGALDSNSLHGACPVHDGIKWAANKWVWNEPKYYISF